MRDIKFEIMFTVHNADFTTRIAKHYTTLDRLTNGNDNMSYDDIEIITKRQFTGFTDKDGTDWYEGDVILWGENYEEIIFDDEMQGFCTESSMLCKDTMVLVGNKFQSPELLEQ